MGNLFGFSSSGDTNKIRVHIKDLRTGRVISIPVQKPFEYTVDQLLSQITTRFPGYDRHHITLKYKKRDIIDDDSTQTTLSQALNLEYSEAINNVSLFVEHVERRGGVTRDWTVHVQTLTGHTYDVSFSNPQEVSIRGLKLLIEDECGIKPDQMRLVFDNQQLEDSVCLIQDVPGISNDSTIYLVMKNT